MSPLDVVESRLREAGCRGGRGLWCCPAHEDRAPSLSVRGGDDGRVLLHCHAGCPTASVIEALGLRWCDLFVGERPRDWAPRVRPVTPLRCRIGMPTVDDLFWSQPDEFIDAHFARLLGKGA